MHAINDKKDGTENVNKYQKLPQTVKQRLAIVLSCLSLCSLFGIELDLDRLWGLHGLGLLSVEGMYETAAIAAADAYSSVNNKLTIIIRTQNSDPRHELIERRGKEQSKSNSAHTIELMDAERGRNVHLLIAKGRLTDEEEETINR
jgi:diphthamide biosynthesis methyltransferase